ncbi:MAG: hypothetical protein IJL02_06645 [Methanobrevibacter sp.]|uniref:hypothetical protein n=1 Tax=Methanobrevibacter sp. TaxID=66852 RepID=UPI0025EABD8F|nr:hypothetical protein [Methanobrevibacter sp.]MBQ6099524.1 hypothetical protein [Methanobrevibacter sp.]
MDSTKKLTLFAVFCVIASACVVCVVDAANPEGLDVGQYPDNDYGLTDDSITDPDSTHSQLAAGEPAENQTDANITVEDAMAESPLFQSAPSNVTINETGNATGNATNATATAHTMLATGNPILALLAVGAGIGATVVISRKK